MALCYNPLLGLAVCLIFCLSGCLGRAPVGVTPSVEAGGQGTSAVQSVTLALSNPEGEALSHAAVLWRPVFAAPEQAVALQSDRDGQVQLAPLWPGVRYWIQVTVDGQHYQRRYTPSAYTHWEWTLGQPLPASFFEAPPLEVPPVKPATLTLLTDSSVEELTEFTALMAYTQPLLTVQKAQNAEHITALQNQASQQVLWWMAHRTPQALQACAEACLDAIEAYVQAGGTLLVSGEWAGLANDTTALTDQLGQRLGFQVARDTLAQSQTALTVDTVHTHALTEGVTRLALHRSSSVEPDALAFAQELAFAAAEHYQILQTDLQTDLQTEAQDLTPLKPQATVLAVLQQGQGRVIVVGDVSLWSGLYLCQADNLRLWQNILRLPVSTVGKSPDAFCDNTLVSQGVVQETL